MNYEDSILGAAIIEPSVVPVICGELSAEDFTTTQTRNTFVAIQSLWESGLPVDLVMLASELERRSILSQVGGTTYLADVVSYTPSSESVVQHEPPRKRKLADEQRVIISKRMSEMRIRKG